MGNYKKFSSQTLFGRGSGYALNGGDSQFLNWKAKLFIRTGKLELLGGGVWKRGHGSRSDWFSQSQHHGGMLQLLSLVK